MIRSARNPAPQAAPQRPTWSSVVAELRATTEAQRWRLMAAKSLPQWQDFIVGWLAVGQELAGSIPHDLLAPASLSQSFDARLAWAWEQVEEIVPMALAVADDRTVLSSADTEFYFRVLQGAALIFPDGSLSPLITDILTATADTMSLQAKVAHNRSFRDALNTAGDIRDIQAAEEARKAKQK